MRAYLPAYNLIVPKSLPDALELLASEPNVWRPFAGGTDLMVLLEAGKLAHRNFFSIHHLPELKGIEETDDELVLGALTTYAEVQANPILQSEFPMLCQAARETGGLAIQNRGTLGGNIVNASPAADSPPALLTYDAELELVSVRSTRRISYKDFHTGYKQMNMSADELLTRIRLPRVKNSRHHYYRKVGTRRAQAISKVCFAGVAQMNGESLAEIRIALGSAAPTVVRCARTEEILKNRKLDDVAIHAAQSEMAREIAPIDDMRSTASYRLRVAANLLADFLSQLKRD